MSEKINSLPDTVIMMAAAHRAWARRFAPWLLWEPR